MTSFPVPVTVPPTASTLVSVDGKNYPLRDASLDARAEGGFAHVTLTQVFANPHAEPLEVEYVLPLPADGAVLGYTITIGDQVIRAEVERREAAKRAYKQALYEGRTAGLLEQQRADTFRQRLGNVPAQTEVRVAIDVLQPLAFRIADGQPAWWEWRFPTVVGVRYDGAPGRTDDAESLAAPRDTQGGIPTRLGCALHVADRRVQGLRCTTHRANVTHAERGATLAFAKGEALDRDVVVRWEACASEPGVAIVEGGGLPGDEGRYALVTVTPPATCERHAARDLTLLIDASGSMSGLPLELAGRVAGDLLRSLAAGDRFEVIAFANQPRDLCGGVREWNERELAGALEKLGALEAGGATEMTTAVRRALEARGREHAQHQVVVLTDGDVSFESEVIAEITAASDTRLHVVGVGSAPNRTLTRQAAAAGRGVEVFAADENATHEAARQLVAATARPVLTGFRLGGTAIEGGAPERLRDVFAGKPLTFALELSREGGTLELTAKSAHALELWVWRVNVPAVSDDSRAALARTALPVGALFGRERIAELELAAPLVRDRSAESDLAIERLGLRHRIASRRTSLVAISERVNADPKRPRRREKLAVELPYGVSAEGVGLQDAWGGERMAACMSMFKGRSAARLALAEVVSHDHVHFRREGRARWSVRRRCRVLDVRRLAPDSVELKLECSPGHGLERDAELRLVLPSGEQRRFKVGACDLEFSDEQAAIERYRIIVSSDDSGPTRPLPDDCLVTLEFDTFTVEFQVPPLDEDRS